MARRGKVVAVGFYQGGAGALELGDEFHHNAVQIAAAQIGNPIDELDRPTLQALTTELVIGGQLSLGGLPRITFPIEEAAAAFDALRRPREVFQVALSF